MELWDAYNSNFEKIEGLTLIRDSQEKIPAGVYHLVCEILVRHTDGTYLLMKRETGIVADSLEKLDWSLGGSCIHCRFLCVTDCEKKSIKLQEGETCDYRWVNAQELLSMSDSELVGWQMKKFVG